MDKKGFGWTKKEFYRHDYEIQYIDGKTCIIREDYSKNIILSVNMQPNDEFFIFF